MKYYPCLSDIKINGENAFSVNFAGDLKYLAKLDADRMLYNFRAAFGEVPECEPVYGWDSPDGLLRGHSMGHFISALSLAYSATGDELYKNKLDYIVRELRRLQLKSHGVPHEFATECTPEDCGQEKWSKNPEVWGEGFLSAYSPDQFALLEQFTPYAKIWAPYYTLHKLIAGLIEAYERTNNTVALDAAVGIGSWVCDRLSPLTPEHRAKMWKMYIAGEYGGMNESLARLALITGDSSFIGGAEMFDNSNIFPGLADGADTIKHLHANQHIPQIMGALLEYRVTGDEYYYRAAENFFDIVTSHHMYAIGGVGQGESFREPDMLAHFIKGDTNCETCATYNMIKIARELYYYSPESAKYMDYIERGLINHILASRNPEITEHMTNGVTYMLPIGPGTQKNYSDDYYSFTCCHGTGMENHVKYGDCIYFIDKNDRNTVYINQYVPSALNADGISVKIDTKFPQPFGEIEICGEHDFKAMLRIPAWCDENPFKVNGEAVKTCGRYAVIEYCGGAALTIEVSFKYTPRFEYLPDMLSEHDIHGEASADKTPKMKLAALLYGPFVMAACEASDEYLHIPAGTKFEEAYESKCGGQRSVSICGNGLTFKPIYEIHGEPYHAYFIVD